MTGVIDYLLIGHISADIAPGSRQLGGTVSYAAPTAQAFGLRVGILTSAAADEPLLQQLAGIATVHLVPADETSTFENIYDGEFRTQMIRGVAEKIRARHIPDEWKNAPLVHIGPVADGVDPAIVHSFPNSMKVLTPQGWLRKWGDDQQVRFKRWFDTDVLSAFDLVVLSEDDIIEAPELEQEIAAVTRYCVVTRGSKGGTWYHQGKKFSYAAVPVDSKYLTGAGDVFAVSLMIAQHKLQGDVETAFQVAARLAAYATTRDGVFESSPTVEEVNLAFEKIKEG